MSPLEGAGSAFAAGFPRVSGDEPWEGSGSRWNPKFSPRERG